MHINFNVHTNIQGVCFIDDLHLKVIAENNQCQIQNYPQLLKFSENQSQKKVKS